LWVLHRYVRVGAVSLLSETGGDGTNICTIIIGLVNIAKHLVLGTALKFQHV